MAYASYEIMLRACPNSQRLLPNSVPLSLLLDFNAAHVCVISRHCCGVYVDWNVQRSSGPVNDFGNLVVHSNGLSYS